MHMLLERVLAIVCILLRAFKTISMWINKTMHSFVFKQYDLDIFRVTQLTWLVHGNAPSARWQTCVILLLI